MPTGLYEIELEDGRQFEVEAPTDWDGQRWSTLLAGLKASRTTEPSGPAVPPARGPAPAPQAALPEPPPAGPEPLRPGAGPPQAAPAEPSAQTPVTIPPPVALQTPASEAPPAAPAAPAGLRPPPQETIDEVLRRWQGFGGAPGLRPLEGHLSTAEDTLLGLDAAARRGVLSAQQVVPAFQAMIEAGNLASATAEARARDAGIFALPLADDESAPSPGVSSLTPLAAFPFAPSQPDGRVIGGPLVPGGAPVSSAARRLAELEAAKRETYRSEAQRNLAEAAGTGAKFKAWIKDPVELTSAIMLESLPASLAGGMAGAPAGPAGLALGIGASSFGATAAGEIIGAAEALNYDMADPAQADAFFRSPDFAQAASQALVKAAVVGGVDAGTARIAGRFLGPAMSQNLRRRVIATGQEAGLQMFGGGGGEALGSVAAGQPIEPFDVFSEAILEVPPIEAAVNIYTQRPGAFAPKTAEDLRQAINGVRSRRELASLLLHPRFKALTDELPVAQVDELKALVRQRSPGLPVRTPPPPPAAPPGAPAGGPGQPPPPTVPGGPSGEALEPGGGMITLAPIPTSVPEVRQRIAAAQTEEELANLVMDPGVRALVADLSPLEQQSLTVQVQDRAAGFQAAQDRAATEQKAAALTGAGSVSGTGQGPAGAGTEERVTTTEQKPDYVYANEASQAWWEKADQLYKEWEAVKGTPAGRQARQRLKEHNALGFTAEGRQLGLAERRINRANPLELIAATPSIHDDLGQRNLTGWRFTGESGVEEGRPWMRVTSPDGTETAVVWTSTLHPLERAALESNTAAAAAKEPPTKPLPGISGKPWTASTPIENIKTGGHYAIVEESELTTSFQEGYDPALQPRDRTRQASKEQIARIVRAFEPQRLGESPTTDLGSPFVDASGQVLSGNGRVSAIRTRYEAGQGTAYRDWLVGAAESFGATPEAVAIMERPVLVRVVDDYGGLSAPEFARQSNEQQILGQSEAEHAVSDAQMLRRTPALLDQFLPDADGNVLAASNRPFLNAFIHATGAQAQLLSKEGYNGPAVTKRVRNAILGAVLGPENRELITQLIENADELGVKNVVNGLLSQAGGLVRLQGTPYDLGALLQRALLDLTRWKQSRQTLNDYLEQGSLFGDPGRTRISDLVMELLATSRSAVKVAQQLERIVRVAREATADQQSGGLFGGAGQSLDEIIERIVNESKATGRTRTAEAGGPDLFQGGGPRFSLTKSPGTPTPPGRSEAPAGGVDRPGIQRGGIGSPATVGELETPAPKGTSPIAGAGSTVAELPASPVTGQRAAPTQFAPAVHRGRLTGVPTADSLREAALAGQEGILDMAKAGQIPAYVIAEARQLIEGDLSVSNFGQQNTPADRYYAARTAWEQARGGPVVNLPDLRRSWRNDHLDVVRAKAGGDWVERQIGESLPQFLARARRDGPLTALGLGDQQQGWNSWMGSEVAVVVDEGKLIAARDGFNFDPYPGTELEPFQRAQALLQAAQALLPSALPTSPVGRGADVVQAPARMAERDAAARQQSLAQRKSVWRKLLDAAYGKVLSPFEAAWQSLTQHDALFMHGRSDSSDIHQIAQAVSTPESGVVATVYSDHIVLENTRGRIVILEAHTARPYIDSREADSKGVKRGGGAQLYQAAFDWAHNNGKVMRPDAALTPINRVRRTSNMLASALRWGTTRHLEPHESQRIEWMPGDDAANLQALAKGEMRNAFKVVPEASSWRWDFQREDFMDSQDHPISRAIFERVAQAHNPALSGIGQTTLMRAVLTASMLKRLEAGEQIRFSRLPGRLRRTVYSLKGTPVAPSQPEPKPQTPAPDQRRLEAVAQAAREEGLKPDEFTVIWSPDWTVTDPETGEQFWVEGALVDGKIVLNAGVPTMADARRRRWVIREEGNHRLLGTPEGRRLIREFAAKHLNAAAREELRKQGYTRDKYASDDAYEQALAEEWIAKQARHNSTWWRRFVEVVRQWLAKHGLARLSRDEAARAILRHLRKQSLVTTPRTGTGLPAAATARTLAAGSRAAGVPNRYHLPTIPVMDRQTGRYAYPPHTELHNLAEELDSLNVWSLTPKPGPIGTEPGPSAADPNLSIFPVAMPEAIEFLQELLGKGKFPKLRERLRGLRGAAAGVAILDPNDPRIELRRDLWAVDPDTAERLRAEARAYAESTAERDRLNPAQQRELEQERLDHLVKEHVQTHPPEWALKVMWHEIGHIVDWLPDQTLARGNIFGHIAAFKDYTRHTLPMGPHVPDRPITPEEKAQLARDAKAALNRELGTFREIIERLMVEEPIYETFNITPDTVKAMFGMNAREQFPELYVWFAAQPDDVKVQIVKAAMRGILDPLIAQQAGRRQVGTRTVEREVRRTVSTGRRPTQAEIIERFRKLVREEMDRRQMADWGRVREELKALIAWWRGTAEMEKYFAKPSEMYAEAFSVFMNNPAAVAARAPYYYRLIQNYMERRPEVQRTYAEIMDRIRAGLVMPERVKRLRDSWAQADFEGMQWRRDAEELRKGDYLDDVLYWLGRRFGPHNRRARQSRTPEGIRAAIGDFNYRATDHERFLNRVEHEVNIPLIAANLDWTDLAELMFHLHVSESRFVRDERGLLRAIANPLGWDPQQSTLRLQEMERQYGPEGWATLNRARDQFRRIYEEMVVVPLRESGQLSETLMQAIEDRVYYATFAAVKEPLKGDALTIEKLLDAAYGNGVGAKIYHQVGQLGRIKNPATATVLKALSLMTSIHRNRLKKEAIALLSEDAGMAKPAKTRWVKPMLRRIGVKLEHGVVMPAETKWVNDHMEPVIEDTSTVGTVIYLEGGRAKAFYVPKQMADMLNESNPTGPRFILNLMKATGGLKRWLTQLNPAFWPVAAARDFFAWSIQMPGVSSPLQYFRYMPPALRASYQYVRGRPNALADAALRRRMKISRMDPSGLATIETEYDYLVAGYGMNPAAWQKEVGRLPALRRFWQAYKETGQISEFAHKIAGMMYLDANHPSMPEWKKQEIVRERAGSPDFLQRAKGNPWMDLVMMFYNPWKEGLVSAAKSARENPWSFTAKTTALMIAPSVLQAMAATGWLGDDVEERYRSVADYDLMNYLVIPLWWVDRKQRKVAYLRLPLWDPFRLGHALMQRTLTGRGRAGQGISSEIAGNVPGLNPMVDAMIALVGYEAFGWNPYDNYTGRHWIDEDAFKVGGWTARKELYKKVWNELGGSVILRLADSRPSDPPKEDIEKILNTPGVQQLVGRWIKVSNRGIFDQDRQLAENIGSERADLRLAAQPILEKIALHEPLTPGERIIMRQPYVMDYVRRRLPEVMRSRSSLLQQRLQRAQTKQEKQAILRAEAARRSPTGLGPAARPGANQPNQ